MRGLVGRIWKWKETLNGKLICGPCLLIIISITLTYAWLSLGGEGLSLSLLGMVVQATTALLSIYVIYMIPEITNAIQKDEAKRLRREFLFRRLVAGRGTTRLTDEYIAALNEIDAEYWDGNDLADAKVISAWRSYCRHLNENMELYAVIALRSAMTTDRERVLTWLSTNQSEDPWVEKWSHEDVQHFDIEQLRRAEYSHDQAVELAFRLLEKEDAEMITSANQPEVAAGLLMAAAKPSPLLSSLYADRHISYLIWKARDVSLYKEFIDALARNLDFRFPSGYLSDNFVRPPSVQARQEALDRLPVHVTKMTKDVADALKGIQESIEEKR